MSTIAVVYASREGHTQKIAERLAARLRRRGAIVEVVDAREALSGFDLGRYDAVILAASVHGGQHEREMREFVRQRRFVLQGMPVAFLSVSLTETTAEDAKASPEARTRASDGVHDMLERFFRDTGFRPSQVRPIAGALLYTRYGLLKRLVMKHIAGKSGGPTDTSRDHDFTDWAGVDRFADAFFDELARSSDLAAAASLVS